MSKFITVFMMLMLAVCVSTVYAYPWDVDISAYSDEPFEVQDNADSTLWTSSYMYYDLYATAVGGEAIAELCFDRYYSPPDVRCYILGSGEDPKDGLFDDTSSEQGCWVRVYTYVGQYGELSYAYAKFYWGGKK